MHVVDVLVVVFSGIFPVAVRSGWRVGLSSAIVQPRTKNSDAELLMSPDASSRPRPSGEIGVASATRRDAGGGGRRKGNTPSPGVEGAATSVPYRSLLDRGEPAYLADYRGNLVYYNREFAAIAEVLYGVTDPASLETTTPLPLRAIFDRLRWDGGEIIRRESAVERGNVAYFLSRHGTLRREDNEISHFYGFYADIGPRSAITRRTAEAQTRLTDFVRAASDCVFETDSSLSITDIRGRAEECFGRPAASILGRRLVDLGAFSPNPAGKQSIADTIAACLPFNDVVMQVTHREGGRRQIAISGVAVFDDETGRFFGYRGAARDVTDAEGRQHELTTVLRQAAEAFTSIARRNRQLESSLAAAQRSARTKVDVLAAMSHELRTPLNAIIGLAEMSAEERLGALDPRYRSYFEDIRNAGQHLLAIINQIYDAIRLDTDQLRIDIVPTPVAELVSGARALVAHAAAARGVPIDDVTTTSPERVLCDATRARQILVNLLNNSIKFTRPGGRVGVEITVAGDRDIDITVWDTGIGIAKERQRQVFESYFRVNDSAKGGDGIGLGLWISRNLADRMGGSLRLTSEVGLGTRVTLRLPRAPAAQA